MKEILKKVLIIFSCGAVFFGVSYFYLTYNFKKQAAAADQKEYDVPYEQIPQNAKILFNLPDESTLMVLLDFENMKIAVSDVNGVGNQDYTVDITQSLLEGLIDRVGGINLDAGGQMYRYVGVQVTDLITNGCNNELKQEIVTQIFKQISISGFSKSDFVYLIENSQGDLKLVDCIDWIDYIKGMSIKTQMSTD